MQRIIKASATIGGMAGFFYILLFLTLFLTKTSTVSNLYKADILMGVFFSYLSLIFFRDYLNQRKMKLYEGFIVGSLSSIIGATIIGGFSYTFWEYLSPDIFQTDLEGAVKVLDKLNDEGKNAFIEQNGEESYNSLIALYKKMTPKLFAEDKFNVITGFGLIFSLVFSIFLRKKTNAA